MKPAGPRRTAHLKILPEANLSAQTPAMPVDPTSHPLLMEQRVLQAPGTPGGRLLVVGGGMAALTIQSKSMSVKAMTERLLR